MIESAVAMQNTATSQWRKC